MDFLKQVGKMIEEEAAKAQQQQVDQQRLQDEMLRPMEPRKRTQRPRAQQTRRTQPPQQPAPATQDQMAALERAQSTPVTVPRPALKLGFTRKDIIKGIIISEVLKPKWKKRKT